MLGIAPWNAPLILGVRAIAVPLACGNTVVLKASEQRPRTHSLIIEAFAAAGFPNGAVNIVTNAPEDAGEIVGTLIDHPAVRRINFTGSTQVGKIIAKRAAEHLKPVLLELGGKAPLVVLDDADLDEAVKAAAFGAFMHQGQICMSTERIIVVDAIADEFVARFRAKAATLSAGDPRIGAAPLGGVIDSKTVDTVRDLVADALEKGAEQLVGGEADGVLMPAHVIDRVTSDMGLYRDESFGPVVAIIRARDEAHAIALANDSDYGLSAAVFTRDVARGLKVAKAIRSGICHVNGATVHDEAHMPFGGTKASGYGRFGGKPGIDSFTELRWITVETAWPLSDLSKVIAASCRRRPWARAPDILRSIDMAELLAERVPGTDRRDLAADVFRPAQPNGVAVVLLRGGGWAQGHRPSVHGYAEELARQGFVAIAAEYRLVTEAPWPAQVQDVRDIVRWVKSRAETLGVDPSKVALQGYSAGAQIALMVGATRPRSALEELLGGDAQGSEVAAIVVFFPPAKLDRDPAALHQPPLRFLLNGGGLQAARAASPIYHLDPGFPTTFILGGMADYMQPLSAGLELLAAFVAAEVEVEFHYLHSQVHDFSSTPRMLPHVIAEVGFFYRRTLIEREALAEEAHAQNLFARACSPQEFAQIAAAAASGSTVAVARQSDQMVSRKSDQMV